MLAYFPGGTLADRYSPRSLMVLSLILTGLGGLYMVTIPGRLGMGMLYAYWGVTTIFFFWAAMIKATREWGGDKTQGVAFGVLEGGRGLCAATVALVTVLMFEALLPEDVRVATLEERRAGFQSIVLVYTALTFVAAALVWLFIPAQANSDTPKYNPLKGMGVVLRRPIVWATAGIIVCAYCGTKALTNYQLYAVQVLGRDEVAASILFTQVSYFRPVAAVLAGVVADRFNSARALATVFVIAVIGYASLSVFVPNGLETRLIYVSFFMTAFCTFALRGIWFALLEENRTPKYLTGAAVGLISLVGYTPEIFFAPIGNRILDANPGVEGFHNFFLFLACIFACGFFLVLTVLWLRRKGVESMWPSRAISVDALT